MKAIQFHEYGSPEVLKLEDVSPPSIKKDEVLVSVQAAGVNPVDWRYRKGQLKWYDWFSSFPRIPGSDFAGEVLETGANVENFHENDPIFGMKSPLSSGTYAQQISVSSSNIARKPDELTMTEAASLPLVSLTSLQALSDIAQLSEGEAILINGASGGVGTVAVQIAKVFGCQVTGVCSHRNTEFVKSLGADKVIDYTKSDFNDSKNEYDVVYDAFGNRSLGKVKNCLRKNGRYVTTDIRMGRWIDVPISRIKPGPSADVIVVQPDGNDLREIASMVKDGDIDAFVDKTYPLAEAEEAHRYSETRRARGKIVITID